MDQQARTLFALVFLAAIALLFFFGMAWLGMRPDLNTTTIHKTQDRLPVACQEGAQ